MTAPWVLSNYEPGQAKCVLCGKPATKLVDNLVIVGVTPVCGEHESPLKQEIERLRAALREIEETAGPSRAWYIARTALEKKDV